MSHTDSLFIKRMSELGHNMWVLGERMGEGIVTDFGMDMYIWLCLKWITSRDPHEKHMELCSMLCDSLDEMGV